MQSPGLPQESLTVVGGTYVERCQMPEWSQLFGSGLRAACALSGRGTDVTLHTYVPDAERALLESVAATFQIGIVASPSPNSFRFEYRHSLATPRLIVSDPDHATLSPLNVDAQTILAFGMLESVPVIRGEWVAYDPQSPLKPVAFHENNSEAKHLALVANWTEAQILSGEHEVERAGQKLLATCEVVVIKKGAHGAYVFADSKMTRVPAFRTRNVFLLGSGDIFSAIFAHGWAVQRKPPHEAAIAASLATAFYCQHTTLPIPLSLPSEFRPDEIQLKNPPKIYLAGPFFSPQQLWMVDEARECLAGQGANVFSPYHDVGFGPIHDVAQQDITALRSCDSVFALLDGYDPGTVFEVGYARAISTAVTALVAVYEPTHITMFEGTGCEIFHDFVSAVYNAVWS